MRLKVVRQDPEKTVIKCPDCHKDIELHHENPDLPNSVDNLTFTENAQPFPNFVVCMNRTAGQYCDFAKAVSLDYGIAE